MSYVRHPASPCQSVLAAVKYKIQSRKRKSYTASQNHSFEIDFINRFGAGCCVFSENALKERGISPKLWMKYAKKFSTLNDFRYRRW